MMKSIYFYYSSADWDDFCHFLKSLNLDFYTYKGKKLDYQMFLSSVLNGEWFVLIPNEIIPMIDQYGQIDEFPNALSFHTIKEAEKTLPAVIFCNEGEFANSVFKKIKIYISSNYLKTDSGKEYISESCYKNWIDRKINLANCPNIMQISSNPKNFSFENFVEYFRQKGYLICDAYHREFGNNMSIREDSYIITTNDITDRDKQIGYVDGIHIRKHRKKGVNVYTFTMDSRNLYHNNEKMLLLFNEIKKYCTTD